MKIEFIKTAKLTPDPRNARMHSDAQIDKVVRSIDEFGWTVPILADDHIRAGHGRLMAAEKIYAAGRRIRLPSGDQLPDGTVPVIDCTGWTEEQRRAYMLADNQLTLAAEWDESILTSELEFLAKVPDFDIALTGFDAADIRRLLSTGAEANDPDDVPDAPEVPVSRLGDIWQCGDHRVICGDSTISETVAALLNGDRPILMVTDPPYGVNYDANWRNEAARTTSGMGNRAIGAGAIGKVLNDDRADWTEAWNLFPGDTAYVWHAGAFAHIVAESLISAGFQMRSQIIWAKQQFAIGRGDYHWQHEPCWYVVRKGRKGHYVGGRKQTTIWNIDKNQSSETGHSTQKPVECMKRPIENNSREGDAVYDPFLGSGTTMIACEMTGRRCFGIELNPSYVDVIVKRWEMFSDKKAAHAATGKTFEARSKPN